MVYQFTSQAGGVAVYTGAIAESLLATIGKRPGVRGVITVAELPAAIAALKAAKAVPEKPEPRAAERDSEREPKVPFAVRVGPFIELLERALAGQADVTWGL
jgi:Domain of unknown function (DUF1840)